MGRVFISYRREDSDATVGRIYDRLKDHFGRENVFRDKGSISPGHRFPHRIEEALTEADAMLVIIGPKWLTVLSEDGRRRLDVKTDWVRREVATALKRDILVIPALVEGAKMPKKSGLPPLLAKLADCNEIEVRGDPDFDDDMRRLITALPPSIVPAVAIESSQVRNGDRSADDLAQAGWTLDNFIEAGWELIENGQSARAIPLLKRATRLAPNNADAWDALGEAYRNGSYDGPEDRADEQLQNALAAYTKATELAPQDPQAWLSKAEVLHELVEYEEAIVALDRGLLALDDNNRKCWEQALWQEKADVLRDMGHEEEAKAAQSNAEQAPSTLDDNIDLDDLGVEFED